MQTLLILSGVLCQFEGNSVKGGLRDQFHFHLRNHYVSMIRAIPIFLCHERQQGNCKLIVKLLYSLFDADRNEYLLHWRNISWFLMFYVDVISEFIKMRISDLSFSNDHVSVVIQSSKTVLYRDGNVRWLRRGHWLGAIILSSFCSLSVVIWL